MQKRKRISRSVFALMALIVIVLVGASGAIAWTAHQNAAQNDLHSRTVDVTIQEPEVDLSGFAGKALCPKRVQFQNTGNAPVFLRVAYSETMNEGDKWRAMDGTEVTKNWTAAWHDQWVDGGDGWYYYTKVLAPDATTAQILSSVQLVADVENNGTYNLDFQAEVVQVSDEVDVNTAATLAAFGKTGTVSDMIVNQFNGSVTSGNVSWS